MALVNLFNTITDAVVGWEPNVFRQIGVESVTSHQIIVDLFPSRITQDPFRIQRKHKTFRNLLRENRLQVLDIHVLPGDWFEGIGNQEKHIINKEKKTLSFSAFGKNHTPKLGHARASAQAYVDPGSASIVVQVIIGLD